jgi:hypothetical protein
MHPEPQPNVPLIRKLWDWLTEQDELRRRGLPNEWDQGFWIAVTDGDNVDSNGNPYFVSDKRLASQILNRVVPRPKNCRTVCCAAGWVVQQIEGVTFRPATGRGIDYISYQGMSYIVPVLAAEELGLLPSESSDLFSASNSLEDMETLLNEILERAGERL